MTTLVDRYGKAFFAGLLWRLWQHRDLLRELMRRDLHEAYAGSALSQAWAMLHPLLLVSLYGFVFGYVFTSQAGSDMPAEPDFAVFMLIGLATWMTVQAARSLSNRAPAGSLGPGGARPPAHWHRRRGRLFGSPVPDRESAAAAGDLPDRRPADAVDRRRAVSFGADGVYPRYP